MHQFQRFLYKPTGAIYWSNYNRVENYWMWQCDRQRSCSNKTFRVRFV